MVTNEMEERNIKQETQKSPFTPKTPLEKRASITEGKRLNLNTSDSSSAATTANLRNHFQKMKSHLTTWFNSLDYDGEYTFDFTGRPEKSETLGELTMQYIDALSQVDLIGGFEYGRRVFQAIMISSHIEYSHHVLSSNPRFQLMCARFCESIFSLAFNEITHQLLDEEVRETLNQYCGHIAEEALQAAFFTMMSKTVIKSDE